MRRSSRHGLQGQRRQRRATWPIVFTKVPECVVGPHDAGAPAGRGGLGPDRLRGRARGRDRPRRARTSRARGRWTTSSATRSSTTSPRATCRCATSSGTWASSFDTFCPMGPWIVDRRRARRPRHARALLGQRRAAPGRPRPRHDLRHPDADRDHLARHHAVSRATSSPPARRPASAWA